MYDSTATKDVRDQIGRIVSRVMSKAIKICEICREDDRKDLPIVQELCTMTKEVMRNLINVLKERTFQSKWSRLEEYFDMLYDIVHDSYQTKFMLNDVQEEGQDDIVTKLCDFMLQQKSPKAKDEPDPRVEMGGSTNKPAFGALVSLASHLVRSQWTK